MVCKYLMHLAEDNGKMEVLTEIYTTAAVTVNELLPE